MIFLRKVFFLFSFFSFQFLHSQNPLFIPDTLSGTNFNLTIQNGTQTFFAGHNTPTYGYNGNYLGPTLLMQKDDSIKINVANTLTVSTTVHWHGFHVAAYNDGGPMQDIPAGGMWNPSFKVRNDAGTFWYHPHGAGQTEKHITRGLAGMIIVRDTIEKKYLLPRKYGVDDFPLIVQTKAIDILYQFAIATHEDSIVMVNGTIDPFLQVPKQVVRFRLLNASADRTYNFGLSDNSNFYLIASDGGMLSAPVTMNRIRLSTGERAEILIDFGTDTIGQQIFLKSYASELPRGIIGADSCGTSSIVIGDGYYSNKLNGADFDILRFDVMASTSSPVTTVPVSFSPVNPIPTASATVTRAFDFFPDTSLSGQQGFVDGPFFINGKTFHMDSINITTYINNIEIWKLVNRTMIAHPFHIHDVQFFVVDINGNPPPLQYQGAKDVMLVLPGDTVRVITQFKDFANDTLPYMYHCHLFHHEDDGMMGSFVVKDTSAHSGINFLNDDKNILVYPNPSDGKFNLKIDLPIAIGIEDLKIKTAGVYNILGKEIYSLNFQINTSSPQGVLRTNFQIDLSSQPRGIYLLKLNFNGKILLRKIILD